MTKIEKIKNLHQFLLKKFKPRKPVILRFSNKMTYRGSYVYNNNKHYITLNKRDNLDTLKDSILHEWGHLLDNNKREYLDTRKDHSDSWAIKYGKIYRGYLEWDKLQE